MVTKTRIDENVFVFYQAFSLIPSGESLKAVHTHEQGKLVIWILLSQMLQGMERITWSR